MGETLEPVRDQVLVSANFGFKIDEKGQMVGLIDGPSISARWSRLR
jgi:hypothetical protein